jgi:heparin binding hemagglutinin HbhA
MATTTKIPATPFYALAGAGDLAIEKLREVREDVTARVAALKDKDVQSELSKRQVEFAKALNKRFETLAADARTVPAQLRELPGFVQTTVTTVVDQAEATYDELADRGKDLVTRIRKQQATEDLVAQAKTTVSKVKATRTSAGKAADAASSNAKATATSARKTAKTATKSAGDAASKIGD